jgi:hypothetical protein
MPISDEYDDGESPQVKIAMIVMSIFTALEDLCMAALKKPRLVCIYVLTKVRPGCKCLIECVLAYSLHFLKRRNSDD